MQKTQAFLIHLWTNAGSKRHRNIRISRCCLGRSAKLEARCQSKSFCLPLVSQCLQLCTGWNPLTEQRPYFVSLLLLTCLRCVHSHCCCAASVRSVWNICPSTPHHPIVKNSPILPSLQTHTQKQTHTAAIGGALQWLWLRTEGAWIMKCPPWPPSLAERRGKCFSLITHLPLPRHCSRWIQMGGLSFPSTRENHVTQPQNWVWRPSALFLQTTGRRVNVHLCLCV